MHYTKRTSKSSFLNFRYGIGNYFQENKATIIMTILILIVSLLTGIFAAIKYNTGVGIDYNNFSLYHYLNGELGSLNLFFSRMLSYEIVLAIVTISSVHFALIPISFLIVAYRSYLLGLNCTLIIILFGLSGTVTTLLIILPCQLLIMLLISIYSCMAIRKALYCKRYGKSYRDSLLSRLLWFTLIITIVNMVETLFLTIFSGRIILIL